MCVAGAGWTSRASVGRRSTREEYKAPGSVSKLYRKYAVVDMKSTFLTPSRGYSSLLRGARGGAAPLLSGLLRPPPRCHKAPSAIVSNHTMSAVGTYWALGYDVVQATVHIAYVAGTECLSADLWAGMDQGW